MQKKESSNMGKLRNKETTELGVKKSDEFIKFKQQIID